MVKLIVGVKGTGKTKQLIDMVNSSAASTKGCVVCIEKGTKLIHEIKYTVRLLNSEEYLVDGAVALYGFVSGIYASNSDVTDVYIDSALKICNNDMKQFELFVAKIEEFTRTHSINVVMTSSIPADEVPDVLRPFVS